MMVFVIFYTLRSILDAQKEVAHNGLISFNKADLIQCLLTCLEEILIWAFVDCDPIMGIKLYDLNIF